MSKRCKSCGENNENILSKLCRSCYFEQAKHNLPEMSQRKKQRLSKYGGERMLFERIWQSRPHKCEECGRFLREARIHNFDHIIPKSHGEQYRYDEKNIKIVCFACHFFKTSGLRYHGPDLDL